MEGLIEWISSTALTNVLLCMIIYTIFSIERKMDKNNTALMGIQIGLSDLLDNDKHRLAIDKVARDKQNQEDIDELLYNTPFSLKDDEDHD